MATSNREGLESTARRTAERIVSLYCRERTSLFQTAFFHGSYARRQPRNGDALAFYLILVDRERPRARFSSHGALLAKLGAVPFGNGSKFLVPGVLYILVTTPGDFNKAARDLHPQVVTLAENYEILYAHDADSRAALEKLLATVKRQAQHQRTA